LLKEILYNVTMAVVGSSAKWRFELAPSLHDVSSVLHELLNKSRVTEGSCPVEHRGIEFGGFSDVSMIEKTLLVDSSMVFGIHTLSHFM
jgi:hypothetical protein